jgi:glycosyltransferase involved in cell wall biosynthesis
VTAPRKLALVMISNFGRADGGRETWAYQFLPRLLARNPALSTNVYALRVDGQSDNSGELIGAIAKEDRNRFSLCFLRARRNWIPNSLKMAWAMLRRGWNAGERDFDLALGVGSFVELICMLLAPGLRGTPKAIWLRTIYLDEKSHRIPEWLRPVGAAIETAVLRRAKLIIANGDDTAAHYRARGLKIEVIKNAVDLDRWRMPPPKLERPINVAFIGRLTAVKGAAEFLEVCRRTTDTGKPYDFQFHVIGDGDFADMARALAAEGRLKLHGMVPNEELPRLLEKMDVCTALTFVRQGADQKGGGSGVSNALLEQMAAGRVCLCWDNAAFRQVLDERSGYFARQGDAGELAARLKQIAENPSEALNRALTGQQLAENYGLDAHMQRFERTVAQWIGAAS